MDVDGLIVFRGGLSDAWIDERSDSDRDSGLRARRVRVVDARDRDKDTAELRRNNTSTSVGDGGEELSVLLDGGDSLDEKDSTVGLPVPLERVVSSVKGAGVQRESFSFKGGTSEIDNAELEGG